MPDMQIILFDIDGTLIHGGGAGGAAIYHGFSAAFGVPETGRVPLSGRTDRAIGRSLFELHGIEDSPENWRRLRAAYLERLPGYMASYPARVLPGVCELLEALSARDDTAMGLLTGNVRDGAQIKLGHFDLYRYFPFGGFGDEHHDRDCVASDALRAAHAHLNGACHSATVWVVGDTPFDVTCGRSIGARTLAVVTGGHDRAELAPYAPDAVLDDLADTADVLRLLGGGA